MRKALELEALPEMVQKWCKDLGLNVTVQYKPSGDEELFPNRLVLEGQDAQMLMANRGQGLDAMQFLVHEVQGERDENRLAYLDVASFRLFRMTEIKSMAAFGIEKTRKFGGHTFTSLSPRERRWIHLTVAREGDLKTESEGTGAFKDLKIMRKD